MFLVGCFVSLLLRLKAFAGYVICKYLLFVLASLFIFFCMSFNSTDIFNFDECSIYHFFLFLIMLLVVGTLCLAKGHEDFLPKSFIVLHCTFKFIINFELVF